MVINNNPITNKCIDSNQSPLLIGNSSLSANILALRNENFDFNLYLKPRVGLSDPESVVNLSDFEIEIHNSEPCIRLYCTVLSKQQQQNEIKVGNNYKGSSEYKDVSLSKDGNITFSTGKIRGGLWINAGRPERAYAWLINYEKKNNAINHAVRSWLISINDFKEALSSVDALNNNNGGIKHNSYALNVDQSAVPNQFFFKKKALDIIIEKSIGETFVTYEKGINHNDLLSKFGISKELKSISIFTSEKGDFRNNRKNKFLLSELNSHYDTWRGINNNMLDHNKNNNDSFCEKLDLLKSFLIKEEIIDNKNDDITTKKVDEFMTKILIPSMNVLGAQIINHNNYSDLIDMAKSKTLYECE